MVDEGFVPVAASLVVLDAKVEDKAQLFELLVERLAAAGLVRNSAAAVTAVLDREATKPTGLSRGVACPHAKTDAVDSLAVAIARLAKPLDFGGVDGLPALHVFLVLSPRETDGNPHIRALASIVKCYRYPGVLEKLAVAATPEEYLSILKSDHED